MKLAPFVLFSSSLLSLAGPVRATERGMLDLETGVVVSGYNDVRIPGDTGTQFSLSEELTADPGIFYRFQAVARLGDRHAVRLLYAPLTLASSGTLDRPLDFLGETFPANTPLEVRYGFNSYRLTYRYSVWLDAGSEAAVGFTGKMRDAAVSVVGAGRAAEKTNVGFVPLLHLLVRWRFADSWGLLFEADALAAPQGRAEDVFLGLEYFPSQLVSLRAGYRMVEGGADNDEVYTFTWIHYGALGASTWF